MKVRVIKTIKGQNPMIESDVSMINMDERENGLINVYPNIEYQEMKGFGGAFTEASAVTIDKLSSENRKKVLKMYFDANDGIGYNFGRVHMNSCDFSLGNYTCVDENDETLETFQINRDKSSVIPMIKDSMAYGKIDLLLSPWSPPAYMKTNGQMNRGGKLKKEYYELWSKYFVKFINAYKNEGIDISYATVQNEPKATQSWDSCVYTAEEEFDFIKNHLGEKLQDVDVKLLFWDHNKERVLDRAKVIFNNDSIPPYLAGIAVHWYSGDYFEELDMFHKLYPSCDIFFTEGCYEYRYGISDTTAIGERYAHDMIGNFNNYCNVFCDWNLVLDEMGGPNHVGNFCDAPIMIDTKNNTINVHASYYYIGHFSKYVKKGAKRIGSSKFSKLLETVSFKNPDNSIVTIVLNQTDNDISFAIQCDGMLFECNAESHSIATYIYTL